MEKGFDRISFFNLYGVDLISILPSIDIAGDLIETEDIESSSSFWIVAQSKTQKIASVMDIIACRYLDAERLGFGVKKESSQDIISDKSKSLNCVISTLPLISRGQKFDLVKEEFYVLNFITGIKSTVNINYSLEVADYKVVDPQKDSPLSK